MANMPNSGFLPTTVKQKGPWSAMANKWWMNGLMLVLRNSWMDRSRNKVVVHIRDRIYDKDIQKHQIEAADLDVQWLLLTYNCGRPTLSAHSVHIPQNCSARVLKGLCDAPWHFMTVFQTATNSPANAWGEIQKAHGAHSAQEGMQGLGRRTLPSVAVEQNVLYSSHQQ